MITLGGPLAKRSCRGPQSLTSRCFGFGGAGFCGAGGPGLFSVDPGERARDNARKTIAAILRVLSIDGTAERAIAPAPAETQADLWNQYLREKHSTPENKWYRIGEAGWDIGIEAAIRDWLQNHAPRV
jgi:hypothetical protein